MSIVSKSGGFNMKQMEIQSSSHTYQIVIGNGIRKKTQQYLPKEYSSIFILTDDNIAPLYLDDVKNSLYDEQVYTMVVKNGEQTKHMDVYSDVMTEAINSGLDRNSLVIALGGGVIGDLAGFVAATLFRGVDYIQMPTTILAHDSSVGGKVAINHGSGKNLIGNFYSPQAVIFDIETLKTLPKHEVRSGYAELIKEAFIADHHFYEQLLSVDLTKPSEISVQEIQDHLRKGIQIKAQIVEADEKEFGERMFLNLGHTLGHALENQLGYGEITHGEAVAIGLLFALKVSEKEFGVDLPYDSLYKWLKQNQYPLQLTSISAASIVEAMKYDKKTVQNQIQMVLLREVGSPVVQTIQDDKLITYLNTFIEKLV